MAFHGCYEVNWGKNSVCDASVLNDFRASKVYGLNEESVPAAKCIRCDGGLSFSNMFLVVPLSFFKSVEKDPPEEIERD